MKDNIKPYLALLIGLICIGMSPIFVTWANVSGITSAFYRTAIAALVFCFPFFHEIKKNISFSAISVAVFGGIFYAINNALFNSSILLSGASVATSLANTAPIWVGIGSIVLFNDHPKKLFWIGTFITLVGIWLITNSSHLDYFAMDFGHVLGLLTGFFYGGYILLNQKGLQEKLSAVSYLWISNSVGALVLLAATHITGHPVIGYTTKTYFALIGLGVISHALGFSLVLYSQRLIKSYHVSSILSFQPVATAILATVFLSQTPTGLQFVAMLIVVAGILLANKKGN